MRILALGTGDSWSKRESNASFILDAGNYYLIDVPKDCKRTFYEIFGDDCDEWISKIEGIFITQVHADHIGDLGSLLCYNKFARDAKTKIFCESFTRQQLKQIYQNLEYVFTANNRKARFSLADYIEFMELIPGEVLEYKGLKLHSRYNWHPIPTLGLKFEQNSKKIAYSGDTIYDIKFLQELLSEGAITENEKSALEGFLWDADLIIHEAAAGMYICHTDIRELESLPPSIREKILLAPISDRVRETYKGELKFMEKGKWYEV